MNYPHIYTINAKIQYLNAKHSTAIRNEKSDAIVSKMVTLFRQDMKFTLATERCKQKQTSVMLTL